MKKILSLLTIITLGFYSILADDGSIGMSPNKVQYNFSTQFFHTGQTSWLTLLPLILLAFVFIALEIYYQKNFFSLIKNFFLFNSLNIESKTSTSYTTTRLNIYAAIGLALASIITFSSLKQLNIFPKITWLTVLTSFVFQLILNLLIYIVLSKLFSQSDSAKLLFITFLYFWAAQSEIGYVLIFLLNFTVSKFLASVFDLIWLAVFLALFLRKLQLELKIFSNAGFQLLHFILYFCAVEIMPLLFIFANIKI